MEAIAAAIERLKVGPSTGFRNMAVFPLHGLSIKAPEYLSLDEALARNEIHITETGHAGTVPEIRVVNESRLPVLLLDGEELVGCKQNRVVNLSILIPAKAVLNIPVSCVEQGRWAWHGNKFTAANRTMYASGRAEKLRAVSMSAKRYSSRQADQAAIWADIRAKTGRIGAVSHTLAMADVYEYANRGIDDYCRRITFPFDAHGAVFAIGQRIRGVETFDASSSWQRYADKVIRSYALDAIGEQEPSDAPVTVSDVERWLRLLQDSRAECYPAIGIGQDVRLEGESVLGAALMTESGSVLHLCAFVAQEKGSQHLRHRRRWAVRRPGRER